MSPKSEEPKERKGSMVYGSANEFLIKQSFPQKDISNLELSVDLKIYRRRWLVLMIFVMYSFCNSVQWIQYSIVGNLISEYYSVSSWEVDLTSMIYMITYLPLAIPVSYLMDNSDHKTSAIIGVTGTMIGSWIKVFSCSPGRFYLSLTGQTFVAISQIFMLTVPPKLASIWFGSKEVSSACGIGTFGTQIGTAASFFLSPMLVKDHEDKSLIGNDLWLMFIYIASFSTVMPVVVLLFFQSEPKKPPTYSQACKVTAAQTKPMDYLKILKRLLTNPDIMIFFITAGVSNGCYNAVLTLFNQIFITYFPDDYTSAGIIGTLMILSGTISSVIFGYLMDRTKKFKEIVLAVYFLSAVSVLILMLALEWKDLIAVYIGAITVGIFLIGFTSASVAFTAEVTYPESEMITTTIIYLAGCIFGLIFTVSVKSINEIFGAYYGMLSFSGILIIGTLIMSTVNLEYKRQKAYEQSKTMHAKCDNLCDKA